MTAPFSAFCHPDPQQAPILGYPLYSHPLKRRKIVVNSEILDYAADMNAAFWLNLKDKWLDDRSKQPGRGCWHLSPYRRLNEQYPEKAALSARAEGARNWRKQVIPLTRQRSPLQS